MSAPTSPRNTCNLIIVEIDQFRRHRLAATIQSWAASRGISVESVVPDKLSSYAFSRSELVYIPLSRSWDYLKPVPLDVPVIVDCDHLPSLDTPVFKNRRVAVRQAFGGSLDASLQLHLPYTHPPSHLKKAAEPDVIIVDWRYWLSSPCHFAFISLLCQLACDYDRLCSAIGRPVQFYFTGFTDPEVYSRTVTVFDRSLQEALSKQHPGTLPKNAPWEKIIENTIPPEPSLEGFDQVFRRGLLFLTDNADLADQDIAVAGSLGIPIKVCARNPWKSHSQISSTLESALSIIDDNFASFLSDAQRLILPAGAPIAQIAQGTRQHPWDNTVLQSLFDKTWERALSWADSGLIDPNLQSAMLAAKQPSFW